LHPGEQQVPGTSARLVLNVAAAAAPMAR